MVETGTDAWRAATRRLQSDLARVFAELQGWLDVDPELFDFHPAPRAWSVRGVCEHLTLMHRFTLVLARKIHDKSARRLAEGNAWPDGEPHFEHLERLAQSNFGWAHPEHMSPTGTVQPAELRRQLSADLTTCLELLDAMPAGEGTLHRIRMSVVEQDDRLDLYQYLAVVALHAERHVAQMERNRFAFLQRAGRPH